jgi:hypothetical protein
VFPNYVYSETKEQHCSFHSKLLVTKTEQFIGLASGGVTSVCCLGGWPWSGQVLSVIEYFRLNCQDLPTGNVDRMHYIEHTKLLLPTPTDGSYSYSSNGFRRHKCRPILRNRTVKGSPLFLLTLRNDVYFTSVSHTIRSLSET